MGVFMYGEHRVKHRVNPYDPDCIVAAFKHGRLVVMILAAILSYFSGPKITLHGRITTVNISTSP